MNDQRTSYGAEDKRSSVQQSCLQTVIAFIAGEKNWTHMPSASGSNSRLADRQNRDELQKFQNSLQAELFGFLLYLIAVQYYNVRNAFSRLFSSKAYLKACFKVQKIWQPFFHVNPYYQVLTYLKIIYYQLLLSLSNM